MEITQKHQCLSADVEADMTEGQKEWVVAGSGAYLFGPSTWEAEAGRSQSSKTL